MTVPGCANPLLMYGDAGGYQIERSLRFNSSDSGYLSKAFGSPTSSVAWTWASWVKKTLITTSTDYRGIFECGAGSNYAYLDFSDNSIRYVNRPTTGTIAVLQTTPVYRDASAWFHVVFAYDSANGTSTDRLRLYVNGTRVTIFSSSTYPDPSQASVFNSAVDHRIGRDAGNNGYFDGYLADIHFIDGQALTPSSFTEVSATTGQLIPKAYSGSFGTNGFHLPFSDNSATTATTLGKDTSGNGNNWTPNNFSVTAGAGNDSLVDTPTSYGTDTYVGGEVRGNYATWNPLANNGGTLSNGNYDHSGTTALTAGTLFSPSGKWYFEVTCNTYSGGFGYAAVGVIKSDQSVSTVPNSIATVPSGLWLYRNDAYKINNGAASASYGNTWTAGDVIGVAFDVDAGKLWFAKNGTWQASGDPAAGTNAAYTNLSGSIGVAINDQGNTTTYSLNTGARAFAYTAPSGFKALCDTNLPAPVVAKPNTVMDVKLDTGANILTAAQGALSGGADLLWIKDRANANNHQLIDTVRGGTATLQSNTTSAETTYSAPSGSSVAWCWDAGTSTVTNTAGSITSSVRANASAGFSVVTYTVGNNTSQTIGHGLNVAPQLIIVKERNQVNNWQVYHASLGNDSFLYLNATNASASNNLWNNTSPTSTVFSIRSGGSANFYDGKDQVAYCFAPVAGYSSFGTWLGSGTTDNGAFIYTGFRPRFILLKNTDNVEQWYIYDSSRSPYNVSYPNLTFLNPNTAASEGSYLNYVTIDFVSNGFKIRGNTGNEISFVGRNYIYACFAESPFQYARAR